MIFNRPPGSCHPLSFCPMAPYRGLLYAKRRAFANSWRSFGRGVPLSSCGRASASCTVRSIEGQTLPQAGLIQSKPARRSLRKGFPCLILRICRGESRNCPVEVWPAEGNAIHRWYGEDRRGCYQMIASPSNSDTQTRVTHHPSIAYVRLCFGPLHIRCCSAACCKRRNYTIGRMKVKLPSGVRPGHFEAALVKRRC